LALPAERRKILLGWRKRPREKENKILVLIDLENLRAGLPAIGPMGFSFLVGFDRTMKQIAHEVGAIEDVFIFSPPHLIQLFGEELYRQGFTIIACPKIRSKGGGEELDTVDQTLIEFGEKAIRQIGGLTHLCLGSGDKDFARLVREAIRRKLKILILASSPQSLSTELIKLSKQVFLFSPTET
jgi:hypothetical protein